MTVIVERDQSLVESFQGALGGGGAVLSSLDQIDDHLRAHPDEFAVVMGASVNLEAAAAFAERARIQRPALGVILVRSRIDSSVLAEALRAGMREVVESRDLTGLGVAVRRAHMVSQAMADSVGHAAEETTVQGRLITVFANKGGVGKSTIATNLAAALADAGHRTCILDLDIEGGDVAIMLQVSPTRSLADLTTFAGGIDRGAVESLVTPTPNGLSVLAAPVHVEGHENVSSDAVNALIERLKEMYDVVVVDTSGSFDDHALHAIDHSDVLVLVGTLDIPALKGLKLATGTLDLLNLPREKWRLVLNRADSKVGLSPKEFADTLGMEVSLSIPSTREVLAAVNRGEPVVRAHPGHAVSKSIIKFARSMMVSNAPGPADNHTAEKSSGRRRLGRQKGAVS